MLKLLPLLLACDSVSGESIDVRVRARQLALLYSKSPLGHSPSKFCWARQSCLCL